jgi:8-oxo-dGTP pyrophosphatase MutT (NUDIX family)
MSDTNPASGDLPKRRPPRVSSGVAIVRQADSGYLFLLLRAFHNWDFPKGMVEQGESPLEAALREVREETAIDDLDFCWGENFIETGPYSKNKLARYYLARTQTEQVQLLVNPTLGRAEHNDYRWVTFDEAQSLLAPRVVRVLEWADAILRESQEQD